LALFSSVESMRASLFSSARRRCVAIIGEFNGYRVPSLHGARVHLSKRVFVVFSLDRRSSIVVECLFCLLYLLDSMAIGARRVVHLRRATRLAARLETVA
jgi:hypothetical protein